MKERKEIMENGCRSLRETQRIIDENLLDNDKGYKTYGQLERNCKCNYCMRMKEYKRE